MAESDENSDPAGSREHGTPSPGRSWARHRRVRQEDDRDAAASGADQDHAGAEISRWTRILVVDREGDSADTLATVLRLHGHKAIAVYDGRGAVEVAKLFRPEVILLDNHLPWIAAEIVCHAIRSFDTRDDHVYAIGLGIEEIERLRPGSSDSGFDAFMSKPVDIELLNRLLRS